MNFFYNGLVAIGIFLGVCATILLEFYFDVFGNSLKISETFAATILGAMIALTGTLFGIYASVEAAKEKQRLLDKTIAFEVFTKLTDVFDCLEKQRRHLLNGDERALVTLGGNVLKKPLSGKYPEVNFTSSERSLLLKYNLDALFNSVSEAKSLQEDLIFLQEKHAELYDTFMKKVISENKFSISNEGRINAAIAITDKYKHDFLEIQNIEKHLRELTNDGTKNLIESIDTLIKFFKDEFKYGIKFSLSSENAGSRIV